MNITVLDASTLNGNLSFLNSFGQVEVFNHTPKEKTAMRIKNADIVLTNKVVLNSQNLTSKTKLICVCATGMNNIDLDFCQKKGIMVKNIVNYSSDSVAQLTLALVLNFANRLPYYIDYGKTKWSQSSIFTHIGKPFNELCSKKWGIVGLGNIGKKVGQIAATFGCEVGYFSSSNTKQITHFKFYEDLEEFLKNCDVITIHSALNEKTQNLIDEKELQLLKPNAILVNMGRGGIVNEEAVAKHIENGHFFYGCDVLETEPMKQNHPFKNISDDKIAITPHIGGGAMEARERLLRQLKENIEVFLQKEN